MTPPTRGYVRLCSSVLVPLVFVALLWPRTEQSTAARLQAARHAGVAPAIPLELPDGVHPHPVIVKAKPKLPPKPAPKANPRVVWPAVQQEAFSGPNKQSVFSGLGAWVDVYDYPVLPLAKTIATLKAAGVQTLYIETGLSSTRYAVVPASVPWLVAA